MQGLRPGPSHRRAAFFPQAVSGAQVQALLSPVALARVAFAGAAADAAALTPLDELKSRVRAKGIPKAGLLSPRQGSPTPRAAKQRVGAEPAATGAQAPQAQAAAALCPVALASGAVAGASVEAVLFPLDCLKTRAQAKGIARAGAARGLYHGLGTGVASAAPGSAVFFGVYELAHDGMRGSDAHGCHHIAAALGASVLGELAASGVRVPADFMKQRLQTGVAGGFWDAARSLANVEGHVLLASWRATATRDVAHSSLQFPLYEGLKLAVASRTGREGGVDSLPAWQAAACGSVSGSVSAVLTTPLDLLRTRVNLRSPGSSTASQSTELKGLASEEIRQIYRQRGVAGFFAGAWYRAACMGLGGFVFMGAFETAKSALSAR